MPYVQAQAVSSFLDSIGINIHPPYPGTLYANENLWFNELVAAGFRHVRTNWDENQPAMDTQIEQLAAVGIKVLITSDAIYARGEDPAVMVSYLVAHPQLAAAITQIAGPNEINTSFANWQTQIVPFMKALYTAIKSNPVTAHIQIVAPNFNNMQYDQSLAVQIGNISQYVDLGDIHGTNGGDAPNDAYFAEVRQTATTMSGTKPLLNTEGGYSYGTDNYGHAVPLPADAVQVDALRYYFDDFTAGIQSSDLYQMMRSVPGDTVWGDDFYLLNDDGSPTPVYKEIAALTQLLKDSSGSTPTSTSLSYSIAGADSATKTLLLQKSDGSFWLAYWEDKQYYEYSVADADKSYTNVAPTQLTLQLSSAANLTFYNPYSGSTAPVSSNSNTTTASLSATPCPQLIEISPAAPQKADTLTLQISEDAWLGDAQFTVSVDGKQVGGTLTAHALHQSGGDEQFILANTWGGGVHQVQIAFINDVYGGTSSRDRNLYVDSVAYDGTPYAGTSFALFSNGAHTVVVGGSTPSAPPALNSLTLHLAEDAYQGNAQFSVAIDGKTLNTPEGVTALHSSSAWQAFTFTGTFGSGNHDIAVSFVNDAYGGSPTKDRNLYIGSINYDGLTFAANGAALMSNSTVHFTVHG